ncbi:hypothetical protein GPJ56_003798 [Histomonas meleagridis]|uniref:uncharacterized protein n=1 Tax=Histomonas meleagridis TaxID=135588 RepID=UPI003559E899|nr:hypothetical protein GPJ56_003798 [Histomonas meleagridis]KAH0805256.1 hypothetical protein GO595_002201 [Histomonas meleagridis]
MSDFGSRHKLSRSHSKRIKGESDSTFLHLTRAKPIYVPKSITFTRDSTPRTQQAFLVENSWITLSDSLSHLISHESAMINEYHAQHIFPPPADTSVEAFLQHFERDSINLDDLEQCEMLKAFCISFSSMFSQHVPYFLLYEKEMTYSELIKQDPIRNSPAIFLLRFFYFLPTMLKSEKPDSEPSKRFQEYLKLMVDFATKNADLYFVMPEQQSQMKSNSKITLVLNKA